MIKTMDKNDKIENLRYTLSRFDHYNEGANSKGNFILAYSVFLLGFAVANFEEIRAINNEAYPQLTLILLIALVVFVLISIGFAISAVFPFLKNNNSSSKKYHSLIFFNSISEMQESEFMEKVKSQKTKDVIKDMSRQAHVVALGLKYKYKKLGWSLRFLNIQLLTILTITLFKII